MVSKLNDRAILRAEITESRAANWTALVEVDMDDYDDEQPPSGHCTLSIEGEAFEGFAISSNVDAGRGKVLVAGGAGGLSKVLSAVHYYRPTLGGVLKDIARESGESVSANVPSSISGRQLPAWSRLSGEAHTAIRQVADELGLEWRVERSGKFWVGQETWPKVAPVFDLVAFSPELRLQTIAYPGTDDESDRPVIRPGVTFNGNRVQRVVTTIENRVLRQDVYYDETRGPSGAIATTLKLVRDLVFPKLMLARMYAGRVTGQEEDGSVTLLLDDLEAGGKWKGLDHVPVTLGLPGTKVTLPNGARMRVFWDGGKPSRARAGLWDQEAPVDSITITVGEKVTIVGNLEVTGEVTAMAGSAPVKLSAHIHPSPMGPTLKPTPEPPAGP